MGFLRLSDVVVLFSSDWVRLVVWAQPESMAQAKYALKNLLRLVPINISKLGNWFFKRTYPDSVNQQTHFIDAFHSLTKLMHTLATRLYGSLGEIAWEQAFQLGIGFDRIGEGMLVQER